jgi:hypothetical protein
VVNKRSSTGALQRKPTRNQSQEGETWSPELLAATATIIITVLAQYQGIYSFLPTGTVVGITSAITVLAAAVLNRLLHNLSRWSQFVITLVITLVIVVVIGIVVYVMDTAPGRDARYRAADWNLLQIPSGPQGKSIPAGITKYGTGSGVDYGSSVLIHIDSSQSNLITWYPTKSTSSKYYAQVEARQISGSTATACTLVFAYKGINSLFQLALRTDGLQLAYWDGKIPARAYEGPTTVPYATNLNNWHSIGVLVSGSQVMAFVDDRLVFSDYIPQSLSGGVSFGTLDIGSGYTDDASCEFRGAQVRTQY